MVQPITKPAAAPAPAPASTVCLQVDGDPLVVRLPRGLLTNELLYQIATDNDHLHFERDAEGALEISPSPGFNSGRRATRIAFQIILWSETTGNGLGIGSGNGISLPNGPGRDPDAGWISDERLARSQFEMDDDGPFPLGPDLIVEVRSRWQTIRKQREKMEEWMGGGVRLGWLIDPYTADGEAWIYREGEPQPERRSRPAFLSGEDVLPGLTVDLAAVWHQLD